MSHDDDEDHEKAHDPSPSLPVPGVQAGELPRDRQAVDERRRSPAGRPEALHLPEREAVRVVTPLKAIRARCLDCVAGNDAEVRRCEIDDCALHRLRMGKGSKGAGGCLKPIRAYCLRCMNGQQVEVRLCPSADRCELHSYRMGRRPAAGAPLASVEARSTGIGRRSAPECPSAPGERPEAPQPALFEVQP